MLTLRSVILVIRVGGWMALQPPARGHAVDPLDAPAVSWAAEVSRDTLQTGRTLTVAPDATSPACSAIYQALALQCGNRREAARTGMRLLIHLFLSVGNRKPHGRRGWHLSSLFPAAG